MCIGFFFSFFFWRIHICYTTYGSLFCLLVVVYVSGWFSLDDALWYCCHSVCCVSLSSLGSTKGGDNYIIWYDILSQWRVNKEEPFIFDIWKRIKYGGLRFWKMIWCLYFFLLNYLIILMLTMRGNRRECF